MKHPAVLVPAMLAGLGLALSALLYDRLPETMAIHWNMSGVADGFAPRAVAALLLPLLTLLLAGVHGLAGRLEPRASNLQRSSRALTALVIGMALVQTLVHAMILAAALGTAVDPIAVAIGATGLLLTLSGNYMGKTRSNFVIGIRNRWTLSDEQVWDRTHRLAGRVLVAEGVAALLVALGGLGGRASGLVLLAVLMATLGLLHLYSLNLWRKRSPGATH